MKIGKSAGDVSAMTWARLSELDELATTLRELASATEISAYSDFRELQGRLLTLVTSQTTLVQEVINAQSQETAELRDVLRWLRPSRASIG